MAHLALDGVPGGALAARWGVPQASLFGRLASCLDAIHEVAAQGAPAGTIVLADEQTAGRGREGRTWRSPAGGVWLGVLLRPTEPVLGVLAVRAGLAVAETVDGLLGAPAAVARLKWPNDVLVENRKLAGVLCEARWQGESLQWVALGVGVNVRNEIPAELRGRAVALRELLPDVRRLDVLDRLVPELVRRTAHCAQLTREECAAFAARDWLHARLIRRPIVGRAVGIGADAALMVETCGRTTAVREGHVELA